MNAINVIQPYRYLGMWVFDDERRGLVQEPFVAGADTMLDRWTVVVPEAERGFRLVFSATPFPGHQYHLVWQRAESGGNTYALAGSDEEGWLCPALMKYFDAAPAELFVKLEPGAR